MRTAALSHHLKRDEVRRSIVGQQDDAVLGVGRDPEDARRTCIVVYLPPGSSAKPPAFVALGGERVRVVARTRGGDLRAHAG
jgi:hypothetical protein